MKDELQIVMQKTLSLQRESEYLNEKLESISAEIFEQKVSFQEKNKKIQKFKLCSINPPKKKAKVAEVSQEEIDSLQSSPTKKIRKSAMLQRQGSIITSDMMQRIIQRSDTTFKQFYDKQIKNYRINWMNLDNYQKQVDFKKILHNQLQILLIQEWNILIR